MSSTGFSPIVLGDLDRRRRAFQEAVMDSSLTGVELLRLKNRWHGKFLRLLDTARSIECLEELRSYEAPDPKLRLKLQGRLRALEAVEKKRQKIKLGVR